MSEVRRQAALMPRPNWGWQDDAACRGKEVVLFFGPDGERQPEREIRERKAKIVCASCPVRTECLSYAVSRPEKYGTWGIRCVPGRMRRRSWPCTECPRCRT